VSVGIASALSFWELKERTKMLHSAQETNTNPDSVYADDNRASLMSATEAEQEGRYAEILWLEAQLSRPLRPHREHYLRTVLTKMEAIYEAQWIELEMAVGLGTALNVRMRVEAHFELPAQLILAAALDDGGRDRSTTQSFDCRPKKALNVKGNGESPIRAKNKQRIRAQFPPGNFNLFHEAPTRLQ
jgi:hypothetical protein